MTRKTLLVLGLVLVIAALPGIYEHVQFQRLMYQSLCLNSTNAGLNVFSVGHCANCYFLLMGGAVLFGEAFPNISNLLLRLRTAY